MQELYNDISLRQYWTHEKIDKDAQKERSVTNQAGSPNRNQSGKCMQMGKGRDVPEGNDDEQASGGAEMRPLGTGMTLDFDPAQLPCHFLAMFWYALLAETAKD